MYDVEVTSNRPDLLSHEGVAREIAALFDLPFEPLAFTLEEAGGRAADATGVAIDVPAELCPHFTCRVLRGVNVGPAPEKVRRRLEAVGSRAINNVVDATNYAMLALGQPSHAFDLDKLAGGRLVVRRAGAGESLTTLDGHARELTPDMVVVADAERATSLAGVMGGAASEVSDATGTVLLEVARWDPLNVRTTARRLALQSEASHRFERGTPPPLVKRTSDYVAALVQQWCGATVLAGHAEAGDDAIETHDVTLRPGRLERLLGIDVPPDEAADALRRLHLAPRVEADGTIVCTAPPHRPDIRIEEDLIEEVARVVGYDRIPTRETIEVRLATPDPLRIAQNLVRQTLAGCGLSEAVTFSFASDALAGAFLPEGLKLQRADAGVRKADGHLRPSLLPGLLESVRRNEAVGTESARLFEIGSAFWYDSDGTPQEHQRLGMAGGGYAAMRGAVEVLLERLDARRPVAVRPADRAGFGKGACGEIIWGEAVVGHVGNCARSVADVLGLREPVAVAELDVPALLAGHVATPENRPLAKFPPAVRDLSLVVPEKVVYADLEAAIRGTDPADLEAVRHVTTYRGKPLAKGEKSVTLQLVFRGESGTLVGEDVDAAVRRAADAARERAGAAVRA